jgi:hypothetical protein
VTACGPPSIAQLARVARYLRLFDHTPRRYPNWIGAERAGMAGLLLPASEDELLGTLSLVDQALTTGTKPLESGFAYLQFLSGMAKYRQGRAGRCLARAGLPIVH